MLFAERLTTIRKERGHNRTQLASILGVTKATVTRWESGTREPRFQMLVKICDTLEVSSDYLLGRTPHADSNQETGENTQKSRII